MILTKLFLRQSQRFAFSSTFYRRFRFNNAKRNSLNCAKFANYAKLIWSESAFPAWRKLAEWMVLLFY